MIPVEWFELNMRNPIPCSGEASVCITSGSEEEYYSDFSSDVDCWAQPHGYGCTFLQLFFWDLQLKSYLKMHLSASSHCSATPWGERGRCFQCKVYRRELLFSVADYSTPEIPILQRNRSPAHVQSIPETLKFPTASAAKIYVHSILVQREFMDCPWNQTAALGAWVYFPLQITLER